MYQTALIQNRGYISISLVLASVTGAVLCSTAMQAPVSLQLIPVGYVRHTTGKLENTMPTGAQNTQDSHSAAFLPLCRETCRLKEEDQEDEMVWEGLSPNRSICLLVCRPGWLLAPVQL
ncbi:hypothetical protein EYF80_009253 [Liparis tanakae]|uniref:Uncharacterized protein n=1 Tax=Liparis tanakae TaxID=230148 RepID=A0A4Z2ISM5_9TELE|nr:hypothetical protein EYF80_009253 [Liparis tanakae]